MIQKHIILFFSILALLMGSCIEDGITTSPSSQPAFSVDTLDIGTVYTEALTVTNRFTVYNRNAKGLNVSRIGMRGENADMFRINVDGMSGRVFENVEIRANDSILVFVEASLPANNSAQPSTVDAYLDFQVNGLTSTVVIRATGQDVKRLNGVVYDVDQTLSGDVPYMVRDSLVVGEGATLRIEPGVKMLFHDKSRLVVRGTLLAEGTAKEPIRLTGDRTGNVLPDVSFDIMSRQWDGVVFHTTSTGNRLTFTEISNTTTGVTVLGDGQASIDAPTLRLENCRLRNSGGTVLAAADASIVALGCEVAEGACGLVVLEGGQHRFDQCTLSNNYLFSAIKGSDWTFLRAEDDFDRPFKALITNTITYGLGTEITCDDITGMDIVFARCLFKSTGEDDNNFVDCIYDTDPMFYTERKDYVFDYRLRPESPAIGMAYASLSEEPLSTDYYGTPRRSDLGAYAFTEPAEN